MPIQGRELLWRLLAQIIRKTTGFPRRVAGTHHVLGDSNTANGSEYLPMAFSLTHLMREFSQSSSEKRIEAVAPASDLPPVRYDIERMNKALEGPEVILPQGLTADEILAFLDKASADIQ